jgi:hypothetical protein
MLAILYGPMISVHPGSFFDIISKGRDVIRYFLFDLLFTLIPKGAFACHYNH